MDLQQDINVAKILSEKSMIARLSTSGWSGRVVDKAITRELTEIKQAKENSVSVTKAIIDKKHFKAIRDIVSGMKRFHNEQTMPWDNNGGRLLPSVHFAAYNNQLRESKQQLEAAVAVFTEEYQAYVDDAEEELGDLFNRRDYPTVNEVKGKFLVDTVFDKVPESGDFRVDIPAHEQTRIQGEIASRVESQHAQAMRQIWLRIYKAVEYMNERLSEEDSVFRNTLVGNIQDLVQILPTLNIMEDETLTEMTNELSEKLCEYTPDDLRRNKVLRQDAVESSQEIMDKIKQMDDIFGAPPTPEDTTLTTSDGAA